MQSVDCLLLGFGYTAKALLSSFENEKRVATTSRKGTPHIQFDLEDESTWDSLPQSKMTFWTFPAAPVELVKKFYKQNGDKLGRLIVVGSTSALIPPNPHAVVNEKSSLDESIERVQGEVWLQRQGATFVLSSGIYGPGRNPIDWIKKGYIGKSEKFVNMIHVEDLASILIQAGRYGKPGELYIASDNNPQRWRDVIESWESRGLVSGIPEKESNRTSKKVDNSWSLKALQVTLQFQNFADSIS